MISITLILLVAGWAVVWSNHLKNGFHFDDFPTIVDNTSVHHLSNTGRFFTNARLTSVEKDSVYYAPLLSSWFAFDNQFLGGKPFVYEIESLACFVVLLVAIFLLVRLLPGVNGYAAAFATFLFGLHPAVTATVNYALRRGVIVAGLGIVCGLLLFIVWPWRLPQKLPLTLKRVPEHGFDEYLRNNYSLLENRYIRFIHFPLGLYLWPVIPALLCDASTAVFAPILVVYILLFETRRPLRAALSAVAVCGGYWLFWLAMTWKYVPFSETPGANYRFSQPWVAFQYLLKFFWPVNAGVDSGFSGFRHFWDPLAITGYVALAAIAGAAFLLARSERWRVVSFGLWWFLIALAPEAIVRGSAVEAPWRMFVPFIGLAAALAGVVSLLMEIWLKPPAPDTEPSGAMLARYFGAAAAAIALLAVCGWRTHERNKVWESDSTLWQDALNANPSSAFALWRHGLSRLSYDDADGSLKEIQAANALLPGDPRIEKDLGLAYARVSKPERAAMSFEKAILNGPGYSPAWSAYSEWLLNENRTREAADKASHAIAIDPYDQTARRSFMDVLAQQHQWAKLQQFAADTLLLLPEDPDAQRSLSIAKIGADDLNRAIRQASSEPTVDHYLALSSLYFDAQKYQDAVDAAREALKIKPDTAEAWANIAAAFHTMGRIDDTIEALQEEVKLNPNLPSARSNLEFVLAVKRGEITEAGQ